MAAAIKHHIKTQQFSSVAQSCLTLCDPIDYSLPGSSIHGIFQARTLERVAIFFSKNAKGVSKHDWATCM